MSTFTYPRMTATLTDITPTIDHIRCRSICFSSCCNPIRTTSEMVVPLHGVAWFCAYGSIGPSHSLSREGARWYVFLPINETYAILRLKLSLKHACRIPVKVQAKLGQALTASIANLSGIRSCTSLPAGLCRSRWQSPRVQP